MITLDDYFGRTSKIEEPSAEVKANAAQLLERVNALLDEIAEAYRMPEAEFPVVNSGWRPASYNAQIPGAAPKSKHITGQAIDISDPEGALDECLMNRSGLLLKYQLHMEHPLATKGWCHLQSVPPRSGNLVFFP